jgi:hypothetical protein
MIQAGRQEGEGELARERKRGKGGRGQKWEGREGRKTNVVVEDAVDRVWVQFWDELILRIEVHENCTGSVGVGFGKRGNFSVKALQDKLGFAVHGTWQDRLSAKKICKEVQGF